MSTATRQPKGTPSGGQFAPSFHSEPDLTLGPGFTAEELKAFAAPIAMPPGSAVYIDGQRGTVSHQPTPPHRIIVDLDAGGTVHTRASDAAPWDAWLEVSMPPVDEDLLDAPVPSPTADRMLHAQLRVLRNSVDAAQDHGDTYHAGRAEAAAETAASLLDTRLDSGGIRAGAKALLAHDRVEGLRDREALTSHASGDEITPLRARQLAGHFADEAVLAYTEAMSAEHRGDQLEAQKHHGRTHAYLASALRFIQGCEPDPHANDREQAMVRALVEGADRPGEVIRAGLRG